MFYDLWPHGTTLTAIWAPSSTSSAWRICMVVCIHHRLCSWSCYPPKHRSYYVLTVREHAVYSYVGVVMPPKKNAMYASLRSRLTWRARSPNAFTWSGWWRKLLNMYIQSEKLSYCDVSSVFHPWSTPASVGYCPCCYHYHYDREVLMLRRVTTTLCN